MTDQFTDEQRRIIDKVEKLMALANRKKGNEEEAANAAARAQEMLAAYNLDIAMVEQGGSSSGKREQAKKAGGSYEHQRDLWRAVAELNFCIYWSSRYWHEKKIKRRTGIWAGEVETVYGLRRRHNVVGKQVNVRLTHVMAEYLEQAIERLVNERIDGQNNMRFSRWAVSYRKGAAARIIEKIQDRRQELEEAEAKRRREAEHAAERSGVSTSTSLTISDVKKSERDANMDFIYGEGYSEQMYERRKKAAEEAERAEAEYAAWAAANPEEARKEEAKRRREEEKRWAKYDRMADSKAARTDMGAYWAGYDKAEKIGIDPQTRNDKQEKRMIE